MWWATVSHHKDDDVDLACHCNVFNVLSCVSAFPSFKEHIFQGTPFSGCFQTSEFTSCSMFKHSLNGKGMVYSPNGKGIMASMEYNISS